MEQNIYETPEFKAVYKSYKEQAKISFQALMDLKHEQQVSRFKTGIIVALLFTIFGLLCLWAIYFIEFS